MSKKETILNAYKQLQEEHQELVDALNVILKHIDISSIIEAVRIDHDRYNDHLQFKED